MILDDQGWRKLNIREPLDQKLWPIFVRGLRDYLIRLASDDGVLLPTTRAPGPDVAKAIGATSEEVPAVVAAIELMLTSGYLLLNHAHSLSISKFKELQATTVQALHSEKTTEIGQKPHGTDVALLRSDQKEKREKGREGERERERNPGFALTPQVIGVRQQDIAEVWEYYCKLRHAVAPRGKPPVFNNTRKRNISSRLRSYDPTRIRLAIDSFLAPKSWYVQQGRIAPEYVFRSDAQLEKHEALPAKTIVGNSSEAEARRVESERRAQEAYERNRANRVPGHEAANYIGKILESLRTNGGNEGKTP